MSFWDSMNFAQFLQLMSLGTATVFFVFVLVFIWKYGPKYIDAINKKADSEKDLAVALKGVQEELRFNRESCSIAQGDVEVAVREAGERLGKQMEDLKRVCVNNLKYTEELNTRHKEHMRKVDEIKGIDNQTLAVVNEIRTRQETLAAQAAK